MRTALKMTNSIKTSEFECYIRSNAVSTTTMVAPIFTKKHITMYPEGPDVIMVPTYYNLYGHELPKDPYFWKNSKKRYCIPKMIPMVYIVDDNIDCLHHTHNLF